MKIKSLYDTSFVEMTFNQDASDASQCQDDLAIDVEVFSSRGFYGSRREVWFLRQTLDEFIHDLEAFEATRRGSAVLSKCPQSAHNDFELRISAIDAGQTMFLAIDLLKIAYTPDDQIHPFRVSSHFVFDPSMLQSIIKDFKRLFRVGE
jgi:hypothetical protein